MVVVLSKFRVANGLAEEVRKAFVARPRLVDDAPGFVRMEVLTPRERPEEFWLWTYWADEGSYRAWHHSHEYKQSHKGIPKGLKLVPQSAEIRFFEHVAD
jgi:heme-degrading monooxygenase HmoA